MVMLSQNCHVRELADVLAVLIGIIKMHLDDEIIVFVGSCSGHYCANLDFIIFASHLHSRIQATAQDIP